MKFKQYLLEQKQYKIYCDLDGVLVNYMKQVKDSGIPQSLYEKDKEEYFKEIEKLGIKFWTDMEWLPDGKELWNFIKNKNVSILSAKTKSPLCKKGKEIWVKRELGDVNLIVTWKKNKKDYANKNSILIDDDKGNIKEWEENDGIGILHTTAKSTIKKLKEILGSE